jgi:hypothetical protein
MWQTRSASIIGQYHKARNRNNQDAVFCGHNTHRTVLVVCDGCGSGQHSEVGASLAAPYLGHRLLAGADVTQALEGLQHNLMLLATGFSQEYNLEKFIHNYCLFTILIAVAAPEDGEIFALGDGVVAWDDGEEHHVQHIQAPGNAPDYLGYSVLMPEWSPTPWQRRWQRPTQRMLIASDGIAGAKVEELWADAMFGHEHQLQRHLNITGRDTNKVIDGVLHKHLGCWQDDTTIAMARRVIEHGF